VTGNRLKPLAAEEIMMDLFQYADKALSRFKKMTLAGFRLASVIFHLHVPVFDWQVSFFICM